MNTFHNDFDLLLLHSSSWVSETLDFYFGGFGALLLVHNGTLKSHHWPLFSPKGLVLPKVLLKCSNKFAL